tara:strand:+ start:35098 stop:35427 length:330 start_codon:yes stop_codon:yes gene_type:complete
MTFKNFKRLTVENNFNVYFINILIYILHIQFHYPELFRILNKAPQFEHGILLFRHKEQQAKLYLKSLKELIRVYQLMQNIPDDVSHIKSKLFANSGFNSISRVDEVRVI